MNTTDKLVEKNIRQYQMQYELRRKYINYLKSHYIYIRCAVEYYRDLGQGREIQELVRFWGFEDLVTENEHRIAAFAQDLDGDIGDFWGKTLAKLEEANSELIKEYKLIFKKGRTVFDYAKPGLKQLNDNTSALAFVRKKYPSYTLSDPEDMKYWQTAAERCSEVINSCYYNFESVRDLILQKKKDKADRISGIVKFILNVGAKTVETYAKGSLGVPPGV